MKTTERLEANEQREREAFDALAAAVSDAQLTTSDWTFERYRRATRGNPAHEVFPDLMFQRIGERLAPSRQRDEARPLAGLKVLDLGAGDGLWSVILAEQGADLVSVEISPGQVQLARRRMENHQLQWDARVGSAYRLLDDFEPGTFDLVFGPAVLHHLTENLHDVYRGVQVILRDGGLAVFQEPFNGLKTLRKLRLSLTRFVPLDAESPDERPLTREDIDPLSGLFSDVHLEYSDVFAKFVRRFGGAPALGASVARLDTRLLHFSLPRRLATSVFIVATK